MSKFFDDTMQGLLAAVAIDKGELPICPKSHMPSSYVVPDQEMELIDQVIQLRKGLHLSQKDIAEKTGNKQQAISRFENKEHTPSLKFFYNVVNALGYEIQLVKKNNYDVSC